MAKLYPQHGGFPAEDKYFKGWMFIGFSDAFPKGKIKARTYMNEDCLVYRSESGQLNMIEPYCSHFGVNMATGKVIGDDIQCPMHGRMYHGNGACRNAKYNGIRSWPVAENRGLAFAWFDNPALASSQQPEWPHPQFLNDTEFPSILWRHARVLELHHPVVPQNNGVDPRHFEFTHAMFGKVTQEGEFRADGYKAYCEMGAELQPPLSILSRGTSSKVTTYYEGPLNDYLISQSGANIQHLCNFLTVINGKTCKLTQIGIGQRSLNPITKIQDWVSAFFSWNATREDAPVWNNRKPMPQNYYPHQTDTAIRQFCEWTDSFEYFPDPEHPQHDDKPLKLVDVG